MIWDSIGDLGGWVLLGVDYHDFHHILENIQGTKQMVLKNKIISNIAWWWSNYHYGGMWELQVNEWGSTNNKHESVHFRCVNGRRNDVSVLVQPDGNGLWLIPLFG